MNSSNGKIPSTELLQAQSHLLKHTFSFINSMALKCAIELAIPDIIHKNKKPVTLSELAASIPVPPSRTSSLQTLMRLLVRSRFFDRRSTESGEDAYSLTTFSCVLVKDKRECISPFVVLMLDRMFLRPWYSLGAWFKSEHPPTAFQVAHGRGVWGATGDDWEFNLLMNVGMASDAGFTNRILVGDWGEAVFGGLRSLVDVGGGTGGMAVAIAEAFPEIKCVVFDLPQVVETLGANAATVEVVGGDFFEYIPPADAMLLKWVLHDWNDEECVTILKRCKEAIPSKAEGGKVIIIEMVVNTDNVDEDLAHVQLLFDVHMMVHTTGKQRSKREWTKIFVGAGFTGYKFGPVLGLRSVIEVYY